MPERMFWTERLFALARLGSRGTSAQVLLRLGFLLAFWLIGAVIYASEGFLIPYISAIGIYEGLYLPGIIILLGAYSVQNSLNKIIHGFKPLLNKNDESFEAFRGRVEGVIYWFVPCLVLGLLFAIFLSGVPVSLTNVLVNGPKLRYVWDIFTALFFDLVAGTGVWMFLGIWFMIIDVSRQEFHVELLDRVSEGFRELMMLTLYYALFYFITISIAVALPLLSIESASWVEVVFSPYLFFVLLGAASVVFPLYSIHVALVKLKSIKMGELREESQFLMRKLEEVQKAGGDVSGTLAIMAGLQAVQLKEKYTQSAPEWPVNIDFVGKLAGLVIMPTIVRIFIELFRSYLPL